MPLDYYYLGDVKNVETQTCLDTMGRRTGENVGISYCHGLGGNQVCVRLIRKSFRTFSEDRDIASEVCIISNVNCVIQVFAYTKRQQIMSDDMCLDAASPQGPVKIVRCHGMGGNQAWVYNDEVRRKCSRGQMIIARNH